MAVYTITYRLDFTNYPGTSIGDTFTLTVTTDGFIGDCTVANGHLISVTGSLEGSVYDITATVLYPAQPTFNPSRGLGGGGLDPAETDSIGGGLLTGVFQYNPISWHVDDEDLGAGGAVIFLVTPNVCRLQIYDDGAGEYLFSAPFNSLLVAGSEDSNTGLPNGAIGPFILPSPLAVTKPGLMTVSISNVNPPLNTGFAVDNSVIPFVALVFAIPKKCRGQLPSIFAQQGRRGTLS